MARLLLALVLGLVGAGIVHISILFLLPHYTNRDAWAVLSAASGYYDTVPVGTGATTALSRSIDPLFGASACRFNLEDGPLHVRAPGHVPFWSVSVYDRNGQNIYSFNDRTAADGVVDFVVLTAAQTIEVRKTLPEEFTDSIFVEAELDEGIVMIRAFIPDRGWSEAVGDFLKNVSCMPVPGAAGATGAVRDTSTLTPALPSNRT